MRYWGATGCHSPDQRPKRFSVLRVSMVRMELCSTRTMGRSAWSGIAGCGDLRWLLWAGGDGEVRLRQPREAAGPAERCRRDYSWQRCMERRGVCVGGGAVVRLVAIVVVVAGGGEGGQQQVYCRPAGGVDLV